MDGKESEQTAWRFLKAKGYHIVERNFRCGHGEIDLIVRKGDLLVFVEVKGRSNTKFAPIEESVPLLKRKRLLRASRAYLSFPGRLEGINSVRFDCVLVNFSLDKPSIKHIENAFS